MVISVCWSRPPIERAGSVKHCCGATSAHPARPRSRRSSIRCPTAERTSSSGWNRSLLRHARSSADRDAWYTIGSRWAWERSACCLWYQTESGFKCEDCSLWTAAESRCPLRGDGKRGSSALILFGSNADTELLALRSVVDDIVHDVGRGPLVPSRAAWTASRRSMASTSSSFVCSAAPTPGPDGFACAPQRACTARAIPLVLAGGEAIPDPILVATSSVPTGVAAAGPRLPGRRRPREHGQPPALPVRHVAVERRGVRSARAGPGRGDLARGGPRPARRRPDAEPSAHRRGVLPGPPRRREHDLRRRPCAPPSSEAGAGRAADLDLLAAPRRRG